MASFMVELWESIFTPGPTPTIVRATNVSFAALQVVLLALLFATFSVHFVILSVLCAGLWWSINWFAAEVAIVQREQKEKEEKEKLQGAGRDSTPARTAAADDSSDTEVEGGAKTTATAKGDKDLRVRQKSQQQQQQSSVGSLSPSGTQSSVSTEDEWEKVSEGEKDKSA